MKKRILILQFGGGIISLIFCFSAVAAGGVATEGIPIKTLLIQTLNFVVFLVLLVYFLKSPILNFFKKRREDFLELEKKAKEFEKDKQTEYEFQKQKLEDMKQQEQNVVRKAQKEGERYRQKKERELQEFKERLEREKKFFIQLEQAHAKRDLLQIIKQTIVKKAEDHLKKESLKESFHQKIQEDFFKKVEESL